MRNWKKSFLTVFGRGAIGVLILFAFWGTAAETAVRRTPKAQETVGDILQRVEFHYQNLKAYTADFIQWTTSVAASSLTTEARGRFYFLKPRHMRWEYSTPEHQVFVAVGDVAWLYVPKDNQVTLFDAEQFRQSPIVKTLFDGAFRLQTHFVPTFDSEDSSDENVVVRLTPKKEDPRVRSVRLWIHVKTYRVWQIEVQDAVGNVNRIRFLNHRELSTLPSSLFTLTISKKALVIDASGNRMTPAEVEALRRKLLQ